MPNLKSFNKKSFHIDNDQDNKFLEEILKLNFNPFLDNAF